MRGSKTTMHVARFAATCRLPTPGVAGVDAAWQRYAPDALCTFRAPITCCPPLRDYPAVNVVSAGSWFYPQTSAANWAYLAPHQKRAAVNFGNNDGSVYLCVALPGDNTPYVSTPLPLNDDYRRIWGTMH